MFIKAMRLLNEMLYINAIYYEKLGLFYEKTSKPPLQKSEK